MSSQLFFVAAYGETGFDTSSVSEKSDLVEPPYTLDDEANTKCSQPFLRESSSRRVVASMFE